MMLILMLMSGVLAAASLPCGAESVCTEVAVQANVEAGQGELTLADLLAGGTCLQLRQAAALVGLGAAPRSESVRVIEGGQIRRLLEGIAGLSVGKMTGMQIPERIVIRRAGATKSCAEIARFVAGFAASEDRARAPFRWQEDLDCAAARRLPEETPLELMKTVWNAALQRWEFALRCARPEDCVPFLVWTRKDKDKEKTSSAGTADARIADARSGAVRRLTFLPESSAAGMPEAPTAGTSGTGWLVKPGQTATLTWEQAGIRAVLAVTCLDAGRLGQVVRVRFKNAARIMWAEVTGEGTLRASP
jgi:Chaperone for flagella basal body P-ring formation